MNLNQIFWTALTSSVLTTAIVSAGAYFARSIIERWLTRSLAKYKVDLQLAASEHQTRFTKLHERRAEVIAELYKRLVRTRRSFERLTMPYFIVGVRTREEPSVEEKHQEVVKNTEEFVEYSIENRIYFTSNVCAKLDELRDEFVRASWELPSPVTDANQCAERYKAVWLKVKGEFMKIEEDIEEEFQLILGVEGQAANLARNRKRAESTPEE